jgi:hypothetical protein
MWPPVLPLTLSLSLIVKFSSCPTHFVHPMWLLPHVLPHVLHSVLPHVLFMSCLVIFIPSDLMFFLHTLSSCPSLWKQKLDWSNSDVPASHRFVILLMTGHQHKVPCSKFISCCVSALPMLWPDASSHSEMHHNIYPWGSTVPLSAPRMNDSDEQYPLQPNGCRNYLPVCEEVETNRKQSPSSGKIETYFTSLSYLDWLN